MRLHWNCIPLLLIVLTACQPMQGPPPNPSLQPSIPLPPAGQDEFILTPAPAAPLPDDPTVRTLVETALDDLAARLQLSPKSVGFVDYTSVVWPDASLGCPQPGVAYAQVAVEGYLIRLVRGKAVYHYHGGEGRGSFLCENSQLPATVAPAP
jgi:hypothetical protein